MTTLRCIDFAQQPKENALVHKDSSVKKNPMKVQVKFKFRQFFLTTIMKEDISFYLSNNKTCIVFAIFFISILTTRANVVSLLVKKFFNETKNILILLGF